jgi:hypothetical protein
MAVTSNSHIESAQVHNSMNMFDTSSIIQRDPLTTLSKDSGWAC